jgi:hypothetical protein
MESPGLFPGFFMYVVLYEYNYLPQIPQKHADNTKAIKPQKQSGRVILTSKMRT